MQNEYKILSSIIKNRRTIRKFKKDKIPAKFLNLILEAGRAAPSAHNSQPWFFVILKSKDKRFALLKNIGNGSSKFLTSINILVKKTIAVMEGAPVLIFVYNDRQLSKKISSFGNYYGEVAHLSEIESISSAIQNINLMAFALGIGTAWLTFPVLLEKEINSFLGIDKELLAIVALGYPDEKKRRTSRKKLSEITFFK